MRWRRRTVASWAIRALTFILPVGAGIAAAAVSSMALPAATTLGESVLHWTLLMCISIAVVLLVDAASRQLLPLATLLELSLLFPGDAPSRFRVALRAGNTRSLERKLAKAREDGDTSLARYAGLVLALVTSISEHDRKTRGHSERVRAYADLIAEELGLTREDRDRLRWAALLHDVGKLEVPGQVLNKDGSPDDDEWRVIREHPTVGARIAAPLLPWLGRWAGTIAQHHERVDGRGYPRGLEGDDICLGARIVSVADAYETMTSVRSYKEPVSPAVARAELAACAGSQFDTGVVRAFMNVSVADLRHIMAPATVLFDVPVVRALAGISEPVASGVTTAAAVTAISFAGTAGAPSGDPDGFELPEMARSDIQTQQQTTPRETISEWPHDMTRLGSIDAGQRTTPRPTTAPDAQGTQSAGDVEQDETPGQRPGSASSEPSRAGGTNTNDAGDTTTSTTTAGDSGVSTAERGDDNPVDTSRLPTDVEVSQPHEPRDKASPDTGATPDVRTPTVEAPEPDDDPDPVPDPPGEGPPPPGVPPSNPPPSAPPPVEPPVGDVPVDPPVDEPPIEMPDPDPVPSGIGGNGPPAG